MNPSRLAAMWSVTQDCDFPISSARTREEQLIAVRIVDLERGITPLYFPGGNGALGKLLLKIRKSLRGQLDEQARSVSMRLILAENDLALAVIDLADLSRAVARVPGLFEAQHLQIEARRAMHVRDEEDGPGIPPMNRGH
jgi:hypothetical protein